MEPQKFEISGEIESTEPKKKGSGIAGRFFLLLFVIVVVSAVFYFPFLQQAFPALKKYTINTTTEGADSLKQQNLNAQLTIDSLKHITDSLLILSADRVMPFADTDNAGIYYKVQIGAFKNFDLKKYKQNLVGMQGIEEGGYAKLTLGKFRDVKTARDFLADVREMGFKDAWMVAEENGKRIPFNNALLGEDTP
jgi:hypothetical protein